MKKVLNIIGKILMGLSLIYIGIYLFHVNLQWTLVKNRLFFVLVFFGGAFGAAFCVYLMSFLWTNILAWISQQKIDMKRAIDVYVKANMGKYLPGNVMHYVERNLFARNMGIGQTETAFSSIMEIVLEVVTGCVIGVLFSFRSFKDVFLKIGKFNWIIFAALIVVLASIIGILFFRKNEKIREILKRLWTKKFWTIFVKGIIGYGIAFWIWGFLLLVILQMVLQCNIPMELYGRVISAYILAWLIGFVTPGAPAGLGVREFVLLTIISSFVPDNYILFSIIFHRVITVFGDAFAFIFCKMFIKLSKENVT